MGNKQAVISLSGGMDSSSLLLRLLREGYQVTALSFDYGQKHKVELEKATELVGYLNSNECIVGKSDRLKYNEITHQIIKLDGLSQLLNSTLVEGGSEVPEGHYEDNNMKDTVVPNRNKIFSSIIQAVALSVSEKYDTDCAIAMGIHAGDHSIYPDCRQEFRDADYDAFLEGNWGAERVVLYTPYLLGDKFDILVDGEKSCTELGLDFDEVYSRTLTSYKPILITTPTIYYKHDNPDRGSDVKVEGTHNWYSDYKSASSVERVESFIKLGRPDPALYADESGPVTWEKVKEEVLKVLNK